MLYRMGIILDVQLAVHLQARIQGGGGALGPAPTPGTEGPAPKARIPSSQGQKKGTLVSLEWLFNTIQA